MRITKRDRIRKDLWFAVLNYSGHGKYVWSGTEAIESNEDDARPQLPTLTEEQFQGWKRDFVSASEKLFPGSSDRLKRWADENLPTAALPQKLRAAWNERLKNNVVGRLSEWFESQKIAIPSDLVESEQRLGSTAGPPDPGLPAQQAQSPLDRLRLLTAACVRRMSWKELSELHIPVTAWARVAGIEGDEKSLDLLRSGADKRDEKRETRDPQ